MNFATIWLPYLAAKNGLFRADKQFSLRKNSKLPEFNNSTDMHYNLGFSLEPPFAPEDDVDEKACLNSSFSLFVFWFLSLQLHPFSNTQTQLRALSLVSGRAEVSLRVPG